MGVPPAALTPPSGPRVPPQQGLLLLTDRRQASRPLLEVIEASVRAGVRHVVLREKDLPGSVRAALARQIATLLAGVGGTLIVAGPAWPGAPGQAVGGLHLSSTDPWPPPGRSTSPLGRSCHSPGDVAAAAAAGAHYATLSPVFASGSKPGYGPALGLEPLGDDHPIPVFALGGVESPERAHQCVQAGASGVAVMGAIMRSTDPEALAADLITAVQR